MELKNFQFCGGKAKLLNGKPNQQREEMTQALVQCSRYKAKTKTFTHLAYQAYRDVENLAVDAWEIKKENDSIHERKC